MKGDRIYIRLIDNMPPGIQEFVAPSYTGFNIYIRSSLDEIERRKALEHAIIHIAHNDFYSGESIQTIEARAHCN